MRSFRYVFADVFTDRPLAGNQLAVFTDARDLDELTMQALALELGFSETVFVLPPREGGTVRIRIFTPRNEIPFAGHPCLGTAFVLGAPLQLGMIALETGSGIVPVELERDESGRIVFGRMTQPVPTVAPYDRADEMLAALGVERLGAAGRAVRQRPPVRVRRAAREGGRCAAQAGQSAARRAVSRLRARVRGLGNELEGPGCSRRRTASARTRPRVRPPARSRVTSAGTAWCPGARRSRSSRARRSAGPPRSLRGRPVRAT